MGWNYYEYGIYQTPNFVYFKGDVCLLVERRDEFVLLKQGIGISGEDIENIRSSDFSRIQKVQLLKTLLLFSDTMRKQPPCLPGRIP